MFSGAEVSLLLQKFLDALIFFSCKFLRADLAWADQEDGSQRLLLQDGVPFHLVVRDKDRTAFCKSLYSPSPPGSGNPGSSQTVPPFAPCSSACAASEEPPLPL